MALSGYRCVQQMYVWSIAFPARQKGGVKLWLCEDL